jgi:hypothetical protein
MEENNNPATTNGSAAANSAPAGLPEEVKKILAGLPADQALEAGRYLKAVHAVVDDGIDPTQLELASAISKYELQRAIIFENEIMPRLKQLTHLGHRTTGPTIAFRWVDAQLKPCRATWKGLSKAEYKARLEAKRREIRLSTEFAELFPFEAEAERRKAGIGVSTSAA